MIQTRGRKGRTSVVNPVLYRPVHTVSAIKRYTYLGVPYRPKYQPIPVDVPGLYRNLSRYTNTSVFFFISIKMHEF